MPTAKKSTAKKAAPKTDDSNALKDNEQAREELAAEQSWPIFKGKVVAAACRLYQKGKLNNSDDISALLNPFHSELREAIGIATGIHEVDQKEKLLTLIVNGHSFEDSIAILQQVVSLELTQEQAKNIILAHQEEVAAWQEATLKERYYPIVFLHASEAWIHTETSDGRIVAKLIHLGLAIGIDEDGYRELIAFHFDPSIDVQAETSEPYYRGLLKTLQERQLPTPLLFSGEYMASKFNQKHLAEFFPQSYYIPNHNSTSTTVRESIHPSYAKRSDYRKIIKEMYQSQSIAEYNEAFSPIIGALEHVYSSLRFVNEPLAQTFCPDVVQALVALPPALRKLLWDKPPFAEEVENIKAMLQQSKIRDLPQLNVIMLQYYQQVMRKEWLRPVGSWPRVKKDLQTFAQTMQDAKERAAQVVVAKELSEEDRRRSYWW